MDEKQSIAESHSAESVQAAAVAQEAAERARAAQMEAAVAKGTAELMITLNTLVIGQQHTNEHLVTLNGKVAEQARQLNTIEIWKAKLEGAGLVFSTGWTIIISALSGCIVLLFEWWRNH